MWTAINHQGITWFLNQKADEYVVMTPEYQAAMTNLIDCLTLRAQQNWATSHMRIPLAYDMRDPQNTMVPGSDF